MQLSLRNLIIIFCTGAILYFTWSYVMDNMFATGEISPKNYKEFRITYKPQDLIVILSHEQGDN